MLAAVAASFSTLEEIGEADPEESGGVTFQSFLMANCK